MPAGRIQEVDVDAAHVLAVLRAELHPTLTVDSMAPYTCLIMRKRVRWEEVHRNRSLLGALFRISGGHLIRQCSLQVAVLTFLQSEAVTHTEEQAENLTYRLRLQMSHLREAKAGSRSPPTRLAHLSAVLDSIAITPKDDVKQLDSMPVFRHVARVPLPLPDLEQPPHEDIFSISSGEDLIDEPCVASAQYEDVDMEIFTPEKKNVKKNVCAPDLALAATPPKGALAPVGDDEIDQFLLGGCKAPTSEQYSQATKARKAKSSKGKGKGKAMKRPAASSPGLIAKSSPRKSLYSKEYHRFRLVLSRQGKPMEECKTRAQAHARAACEKAGF